MNADLALLGARPLGLKYALQAADMFHNSRWLAVADGVGALRIQP